MHRKIGFYFLVVACVFFLSSSDVFAQAAWYTCSVQQAGTVDGSTRYVWLTDTASPQAFVNKAFILTQTAISNEQMATLLTALSSGKNIYVNLNVTGGRAGYIYIKN